MAANINILGNIKTAEDENLGLLGSYSKNLSSNEKISKSIKDNTSTPSYNVEFGQSQMSTFDYQRKSSTGSQIAQAAQNVDLKNLANFDILLSHTLSDEDYSKARENGFDLKEVDMSDSSTILDSIKVALAKGGTYISGFNDDLDIDMVESITGDLGLAKDIADAFKQNDIPLTKENIKSVNSAMEKGAELSSPTRESVNYLIENELDTSVDNLYLAEHVTNGMKSGKSDFFLEEGGYIAQRSADENFSEIKKSIQDVITDSGLEVNNDTEEMAKELITDAIALNKENLTKKYDIENLQFPLDKKMLIFAGANAIASGEEPAKADLTKISFDIKKQIRTQEVRLEMSSSANINVAVKNDSFAIDTSLIEDNIKELEDTLKNIVSVAQDLSEEEKNIATNTATAVKGIWYSPAALIGAVKDEFKVDTLDDIYKKGTTLTISYEKAMTTYEAVGTSPRADLGDSIKKAFRNVDEILKDMGKELTDENRRTVRILGYNSTSISEENFENVKSWDEKLTNTLSKMKPARVLDMIREEKNPLKMTLDELDEYFDESDKGDKNKSDEKYSRFLYKMEKSGKISEEEKESYIGIYRLFENLKKTDNAAIGLVLNTNEQMTIGNLLTANRSLSRAKRQMDYKIDDDFESISSKDGKGISIDAQIESAFRYYSASADKAYENIDPLKMQNFENNSGPIENAMLDTFANSMQKDLDDSKKEDASYDKEMAKEIRDIMKNSEVKEDAKVLEENGIKVSSINLDAFDRLKKSRQKEDKKNNIWQQIRDKVGDKKYLEDIGKMPGDYKENLEEMQEDIENLKEQADTYIDMKTLSMMHRQISVANKIADSGEYDVPVELDEDFVSMHVKLVNSKDNEKSVNISIDSGKYGVIDAEVIFGEKTYASISTSFAKDNSTRNFMERLSDNFGEAIGEDIDVFYKGDKNLKQDSIAPSKERNIEKSSNELFDIAKKFAGNLKDVYRELEVL